MYVTNKFEILHEKLYEPFCVSTHVGESSLGKWVYNDCVISIKYNDTMTDVIDLDMVDFDFIFRTDMLYASIDCRTRVVKFKIPNEPFLEWKSILIALKGLFISYVKANFQGLCL